jgi:hypothetical protein
LRPRTKQQQQRKSSQELLMKGQRVSSRWLFETWFASHWHAPFSLVVQLQDSQQQRMTMRRRMMQAQVQLRARQQRQSWQQQLPF